jgi:transcriptional regulator with XRE-family HTH domain
MCVRVAWPTVMPSHRSDRFALVEGKQSFVPVSDDRVQQVGVGAVRADVEQGHPVCRGSHLAGCHRTHCIRCFMFTVNSDLAMAPSSVQVVGFPENLAAIRRDRGLTQAALAERVGVHSNQLSRYEQGLSEPTLSVVRQLAIALSVSADALIFGGDARLPDDEALRLAFEATVLLDDEERAAVKTMLDGFLAHHDARRGGEGPRGQQSKRG